MNIQTTVRTEIKEMNEGFCVFVFVEYQERPIYTTICQTIEEAKQAEEMYLDYAKGGRL